jgi:arsenate reductase
MIIIYYKAKCSKCETALDLLEQNNCEIEMREVSKKSLSKKELKELLAKLGCKPIDLVRKKENLYKEKFEGKNFTDSEWLQILTEHPELIERPIIVDGYKAIIGRPPELVLDLINRKKN